MPPTPEQYRRAATALERSAARLRASNVFRLADQAGTRTWQGTVADDARATLAARVTQLRTTIDRMERRARHLRTEATRLELSRR